MTRNSLCVYFLIFIMDALSACSTAAPDRSINIGGITLAANTSKSADSSSDVFIKASKLVHDVAYYLKVGSDTLCGSYVTHDAGLTYLDSAMLERIGLQGNAAQFGAGGQLSVFHVTPNSAADEAGVKDGDVIEGVSSQEIAESAPEKNPIKMKLDQAVKSGKPFTLTLRRGLDRIEAVITADAACDFNVAVQVRGGPCCSIFVWREPSQYKEPVWYSFEEGAEFDPILAESALALYISHNAAHVLMGHPEQLAKAQHPGRTTGVPSAVSVFGPAAADVGSLTPPFNQRTDSEMRNEFEPKADLLSLYMLAMSGYGTETAVSTLNKLAGPKGAPNFPQLHVFTEPSDSWKNFTQPSSTPGKLVTGPLNKASRLTKMRLSKIEAEASKIENKLNTHIPITERIGSEPLTSDVTELQRIIGEIDRTRTPEPAITDEPPKPTGNIIFGEPYFH